MFADDITLLYSHPDISSEINVIKKELSEVSNWFKLSVNGSKTNNMVLGTSHITNKYILTNAVMVIIQLDEIANIAFLK